MCAARATNKQLQDRHASGTEGKDGQFCAAQYYQAGHRAGTVHILCGNYQTAGDGKR